MTEIEPLQVRVNALSSEVLFAQPSVGKLRERLQALHGDVDARVRHDPMAEPPGPLFPTDICRSGDSDG